MTEFSNRDDVIDIRDIIARIEALEPEVSTMVGVDFEEEPARFAELVSQDERDEPVELQRWYSLMADLCGQGGDEHWRGDWYPITLIKDDHFQAYAEELAEDCGMVSKDAKWPNDCIDWAKAAYHLKMDYSSVEFDGVTYWVR